uniref:Sinapine synthase n=1 Tax=Brassica napus TaxID=3708 RepID=Q7M1I5_BRANA
GYVLGNPAVIDGESNILYLEDPAGIVPGVVQQISLGNR